LNVAPQLSRCAIAIPDPTILQVIKHLLRRRRSASAAFSPAAATNARTAGPAASAHDRAASAAGDDDLAIFSAVTTRDEIQLEVFELAEHRLACNAVHNNALFSLYATEHSERIMARTSVRLRARVALLFIG
jgi:hypothetical protein